MLSKYLWQALRRLSADIGDNWDMNQQTQSPHSVFFLFFCYLFPSLPESESQNLCQGSTVFFPRIHSF